ncbi:hypothetical protein [Photorhabdus laumondii]|uniref:hypothetical protein n=1 Tax=Photorhabdus laumondii TaxID=2218628 RepID=UPI000A75C7F7|nr:hypothetical protein [Photorhabdus laumondii]
MDKLVVLVEFFFDIDDFSRVFIPQWFSVSSPNFTLGYQRPNCVSSSPFNMAVRVALNNHLLK